MGGLAVANDFEVALAKDGLTGVDHVHYCRTPVKRTEVPIAGAIAWLVATG